MLIWPWGSSVNEIGIKTSFDHVLLIGIFRFYDLALIWMPMSQWLSVESGGEAGHLLFHDNSPLCTGVCMGWSWSYAGIHTNNSPDSKNMGPTWVLLAPDGAHVGPMNLAIGGHSSMLLWLQSTPNTYLFSLMVNMLISHGSPSPNKYMILQNHLSVLRSGLGLFAVISSSDCTMCIFKRQGVTSFIYHLNQEQFNYGEMMTCAPRMVRWHHLWQSHPQIFFINKELWTVSIGQEEWTAKVSL